MTHVQDEIRETPCRKGPPPIGTVQTLSARCFIFLRPVLCEPPRRFCPPPWPVESISQFFRRSSNAAPQMPQQQLPVGGERERDHQGGL